MAPFDVILQTCDSRPGSKLSNCGNVSSANLEIFLLNRKKKKKKTGISQMQVHKLKKIVTQSIIKRRHSLYKLIHLLTLIYWNVIFNMFVGIQMPQKFQFLKE